MFLIFLFLFLKFCWIWFLHFLIYLFNFYLILLLSFLSLSSLSINSKFFLKFNSVSKYILLMVKFSKIFNTFLHHFSSSYLISNCCLTFKSWARLWMIKCSLSASSKLRNFRLMSFSCKDFFFSKILVWFRFILSWNFRVYNLLQFFLINSSWVIVFPFYITCFKWRLHDFQFITYQFVIFRFFFDKLSPFHFVFITLWT